MPEYVLYSYFRSSCSARVRIALNLKGLEYDLRPVNLLKNEQLSDEHRALNPSGTVPLFVAKDDAGVALRIGQSVAILEYLEEAHPQTPLLPSDLQKRAVVRALVNIICCDTQPVTNLRISRRVKEAGGDAEKWMVDLMGEGLGAYEKVLKDWTGKYSVGDEPTLADVCLLPAVWNAQRYGVDLSRFPNVERIAREFEKLGPVHRAGYFTQPDTPAELRKE